MSRTRRSVLAGIILWAITGCGGPANNTTGNSAAAVLTHVPAQPVHVVRAVYNPSRRAAVLDVSLDNPVDERSGVSLQARASLPSPGGTRPEGAKEDLVDLRTADGPVNYATAHFADKPVQQVDVVNRSVSASGRHSFNRLRYPVFAVDTTGRTAGATAAPPTASLAAGSVTPVPATGTTMDPSIQPLASPNAGYQQKWQAVQQVATSQLDAPYVWGHSADRGQVGFDCSNFTAYVYHHALGYKMTNMSRNQLYVGNPVNKSQMRPGDLLVFENGAHVGIFTGNNQMIQCGGGKAKVTYLTIAPGSFWGNHLTAVRRLF